VNVHGAFILGKAVLPTMLEQRYGRIVHIASISGREGNAGMLAYSASKAGLIGMVKVQGKEYAENGITVNAIARADIRTPMVAELPDAQVEYMTSRIPMRRCGTLDEVSEMPGWILSPAASFTTGFTFDLSGGRATYSMDVGGRVRRATGIRSRRSVRLLGLVCASRDRGRGRENLVEERFGRARHVSVRIPEDADGPPLP
jgi:hypothetical protein